ncbi:hypothetical protein JCM6882_008847 [Rhodosporidiobolus microsporus]
MILQLLAPLAVLLVLQYLFALSQVLRSTRNQPRFFTFLPPYAPILSLLFPFAKRPHPRFFVNRHAAWKLKGDLYIQSGSSILLLVSFVPWPRVVVLVGDGKVINAINADRKTFSKPAHANHPILSHWGPNILTAEGEPWRRHRRVAVSSFGERGVKEVWDAAKRWTAEWHERLGKGETRVEKVENELATLTLLVITQTAFGIPFPWPSSSPDGSSPLFNATNTVLRDFALPALLPSFLMRHLPHREVRRVNGDFEHFEGELKRIIKERREEVVKGEADEKHDLLTALVRANLAEAEAKNKLSDQELLSDTFIFVVAGQETSANALSALFLLLALYPSHQDTLHGEISAYLKSTSGAFDYCTAFSSLPYTLATIQEGLRLVGPVNSLVKAANTDTVLKASSVPVEGKDEGEQRSVFVKKGWDLREHLVGAHYNADVWPDPFEFDPSRFLKDWDRESLVPFSTGLRGCIGRHMAMAEMVVILALTMLHYRIEIPAARKEEYALKPGENERGRRDRLLNGAWPFTMQPRRIDLSFVRREECEKKEE